MFDTSILSQFFLIHAILLPFIKRNLKRLLVLNLWSFIQWNAWLRGSTEIYYTYICKGVWLSHQCTGTTFFLSISSQLVYIYSITCISIMGKFAIALYINVWIPSINFYSFHYIDKVWMTNNISDEKNTLRLMVVAP